MPQRLQFPSTYSRKCSADSNPKLQSESALCAALESNIHPQNEIPIAITHLSGALKSKSSRMGIGLARVVSMQGAKGMERGADVPSLEFLPICPALPVLIFQDRDNLVDDAIQGRAFGILQH